MEHANAVAKDKSGIGSAPIPTSVRRSVLPDPETTRSKVGNKDGYRKEVEQTTSKIKQQEKKVEEPIFSRDDEPEVTGTIVITIYKNHPYDVEFSGDNGE